MNKLSPLRPLLYTIGHHLVISPRRHCLFCFVFQARMAPNGFCHDCFLVETNSRKCFDSTQCRLRGEISSLAMSLELLVTLNQRSGPGAGGDKKDEKELLNHLYPRQLHLEQNSLLNPRNPLNLSRWPCHDHGSSLKSEVLLGRTAAYCWLADSCITALETPMSDNKRVKIGFTYIQGMGYGLRLEIERPWDGENQLRSN
jgi:hypothetical protein